LRLRRGVGRALELVVVTAVAVAGTDGTQPVLPLLVPCPANAGRDVGLHRVALCGSVIWESKEGVSARAEKVHQAELTRASRLIEEKSRHTGALGRVVGGDGRRGVHATGDPRALVGTHFVGGTHGARVIAAKISLHTNTLPDTVGTGVGV
jgi:hypothetical protein